MSLKDELQNIISGNGSVRNGKTIQAINHHIRREKKSVSTPENGKFLKQEETKILLTYISEHNLWCSAPKESNYIGEGAEQKVYEHSDPDYIVKLNDCIFYEFWEDYFNSLLLHNYFFPRLAYELLGFHQSGATLYAVVKQLFVTATDFTNLEYIRDFLSENGFINKKANDYYHPELGIILEDLHNENVLTEDGILQFIDSVFYLTPKFYEKD
jgi:hypothetical protein